MRIVIASMVVRSAQMFGMAVSDLTGRSRMREYTEARYAVIVAGHHLGFSWSEIGRALNRDHTTIMDGYKRGSALCKSQYGFSDIVGEILDAAIPGSAETIAGPWSLAA